MLVIEELLTIFPIHELTRDQNIFDSFKNYVKYKFSNLQIGINNH